MKNTYPLIKSISAQKAKSLYLFLSMEIGMSMLLLLAVTSLKAQTNSNTNNKATYTYKIIAAKANTFGYDIYRDGVLIVHQPTIPGKPGWLAFSTKQQAVEAAIKIIEAKQNPSLPIATSNADRPSSK